MHEVASEEISKDLGTGPLQSGRTQRQLTEACLKKSENENLASVKGDWTALSFGKTVSLNPVGCATPSRLAKCFSITTTWGGG